MTRHGFRYVVVSQRPLGEDRFFPYVLDDVGWAHRHGYGSGMSAIARRLDHRYAAVTQARYGSTIDTVRRLQHEALPRAGVIMRPPHAVAVSAAAT